jgi:hypothetical protein
MSVPASSTRRPTIADTIDDDDEDDALLPDAEKTKDDGQAAADDAEDGTLFEDDEMAKQAGFSTQITEDMRSEA